MRKDLTNQIFGRLKVIKFSHTKKEQNRNFWLCRCECGNEKIVEASHLIRHNTTSCGCKRKEILLHIKHNMSRTKIYSTYYAMIKRCYVRNNPSYKHYGGRGITVVSEWLDKENGFLNFYNCVSKLPHFGEQGYSLNRIDNNGNYEPNNIEWATNLEQSNNRRSSKLITINNETKSIAQWAKIAGISAAGMCSRLQRGVAGIDLLKPARSGKQ